MKTLISIVITIIVCGCVMPDSANAQRYWNTAVRVSGTKYLAVKPGTALAGISADYTLECWFNSSSAASATLFGKDAFRLLLDESGGYLRVRVQVNGTTRLYSSYARRFLPNTWNHVACSYDSTSRRMWIYVNGDIDTSETFASNIDPAPGTDTLFVGKSVFGSGEVLIDNIRIWNKQVDVNYLNKIYRTVHFGESSSHSLVYAAGLENPVTGPFANLYTVSQNFTSNRGAEPVHLGKNPSVTGALNTALYLDGNGDYARMKTNPDIEFTGAMTVEFWVNPDTIAQGFNYIISKKTGHNNPNGWGIYYDSGAVRLQVNNSTTFFNNSVPPRKWSHIAVTKPSGDGAKLYINGVLSSSNSSIDPPNPSNDSLIIGKNPSSSFTFKGYIDGIKLSNYEKTEQEIKKSVYEITDNSNAPSPPFKTVAINFDYESIDTSFQAFNGTDYELRSSAVITRPYIESRYVPVSPVLGTHVSSFPEGYTIKYSGNRIPESNTAGFMRTDSIYVGNDAAINDINFFLSINHESQSDLQITLYSPAGDSLRLWNQEAGIESRDHIITIFDDQADSTLASNKYLDFGPRIRPVSSINSRFSGENARGYWKLKITDFNNSNTGWLYGWGLQINDQVLVGTENTASEIPANFKLEQNYPNPFNPATRINYELPVTNYVKLNVYDIAGKLVKALVNEKQPAGSYRVTFDGTGLASGVYFYKLSAGEFTDVKKMVLVK